MLYLGQKSVSTPLIWAPPLPPSKTNPLNWDVEPLYSVGYALNLSETPRLRQTRALGSAPPKMWQSSIKEYLNYVIGHHVNLGWTETVLFHVAPSHRY